MAFSRPNYFCFKQAVKVQKKCYTIIYRIRIKFFPFVIPAEAEGTVKCGNPAIIDNFWIPHQAHNDRMAAETIVKKPLFKRLLTINPIQVRSC